MKTKIRLFTSTLLLVLVISANCHGWNDRGHMAVAYVTYQRLTPQARSRVDDLIRLNPRFAIWLGNIPPATPQSTKASMLFMMAATWADQIKSDPNYFREDAEGSGPTDLFSGYRDRGQHQDWHFVDQPFTLDGVPLQPPSTPNLQTQIPGLRAILSSFNSDEIKSYALVWLIHLVGDVHQPLHATSRFTLSLEKRGYAGGDFGGNRVFICDPQCGGNLHSLWDSLLGTGSNPLVAMTTAQGLRAPDQALAANLDLAVWLKEDLELAKTAVYVSPIGPGVGPYKITLDYRNKARTIAMQRVALAGVRLARILNTELK